MLIAIVGATASGKSDLAVELALALRGEVINADSMQLYRGMDIGTAKLSMAERRGVPHHLLDVWDVTRTASVAEYQVLAGHVIDDIEARGLVPVLVGGSGLYIRAALGDLEFPGTDEGIRSRLEGELAAHGPGVLHQRLRTADPAAAAAILPSNGRRIVRALEVIELSGRAFSATLPGYDAGRPAVQVGLGIERPELDQRIEARVDRMWAAGFEAEVRGLAARGLREGRTASRALGYQQMLRALDGEWTLDQARDETVRSTRRFARRQESWFRRDPRVTWLAPGADRTARALALVRGRDEGLYRHLQLFRHGSHCRHYCKPASHFGPLVAVRDSRCQGSGRRPGGSWHSGIRWPATISELIDGSVALLGHVWLNVTFRCLPPVTLAASDSSLVGPGERSPPFMAA